MATYNNKRDPMRVMWRRVMMVVLLVVLAFAIHGVWDVYQKSKDSAILRSEAQAKLDDLQKREAELRANIASLHSQTGVEAELRQRYDLAEPGEGVVVIVDPPTASPPEAKPTTFQRLKSWFSW